MPTKKTEQEAGAARPEGTVSGGVPARAPDLPDPETVPRRKRLWRWWLAKAVVIAGKQNRALAWLGYYLGLGPVGWWMKRFGKSQLDRALHPSSEMGWTPRPEPIACDPQRIRRPF